MCPKNVCDAAPCFISWHEILQSSFVAGLGQRSEVTLRTQVAHLAI